MTIQLRKFLRIVNGVREPVSVARHRTAAILVADVVGYTRLMCVDQDRTYADYAAYRRQLVDPLVVSHGGRVVKSTGDGFLAEFGSAVSAARCAILLQQYVAERNQEIPPDRRIVFRLGLSYGTIIADDDDIYGKEVNVAARLQTLASVDLLRPVLPQGCGSAPCSSAPRRTAAYWARIRQLGSHRSCGWYRARPGLAATDTAGFRVEHCAARPRSRLASRDQGTQRGAAA
jgi:class 3 adenylate cyclase